MSKSNCMVCLLALGGTLLLGIASPTAAQTADTMFAKRPTINLYIGYAPGGSYDLYARMIARHLGRHLPNQPPIVAQNMPGAGSLQAANFLYKVAPRDGTAIAVVAETLPMEQALRNPGVQFDAAKFTYIGRVAGSNNIQIQWHTAKAKTAEDVKTIETAVAGTGPANLAETVPKVLNAVAGTKFKIVSGYASSGPAMLAMERGEVDGTGTSWAIIKSQRQDWLRDKKINIILQFLPERAPDLPDVPALLEMGRTAEDKQLLNLYASGGALGRYLIAPPDLPADVTAALRKGLMAMVKDPELLAEAAKANVDIEPSTHDRLEAVVTSTLQVPDSVRVRVREIFR